MPQPPRQRGLTRRGLLKSGLGLTGLAGLVMPGTTAFAAVEAANDLIITDYRPVPPAWPDSHKLTITVIADLHAGGPNMGIERVRQVVDAGNALGSDLVVILGDYFATHRFVTEQVPHDAWAAELARLKAPLGVYSILGNHDWWYDHRRRAQRAAQGAHSAAGERGGAAGPAGRKVLAGRARRSARPLARTERISRRRRSARHACQSHDRPTR